MVTHQVCFGDGALIVKSFNTSAQEVDLSQQLHMLMNRKQETEPSHTGAQHHWAVTRQDQMCAARFRFSGGGASCQL